MSAHNLAALLGQEGAFSEGTRIHRETLEARRRVLGAEHPDTLMSAHNLAGVLGQQGEFSEAAEIHRETLEVQKRVLGSRHPHTLLSARKLGIALKGASPTSGPAGSGSAQGCEESGAPEASPAAQGGASASSSAVAGGENEEEAVASCSICLDGSASWIFEACGHKCICKACARKQKEKATGAAAKKRGKRRPPLVACPLCRCETRVVPASRHDGEVFE
jgi:hypothetical protein